MWGFACRDVTLGKDPYTRELIESKGWHHPGEIFSIDWHLPEGVGPHDPLADCGGSTPAGIALVLAGLSGGSQETYCKAAVAALASKGFRVAVMNARGCGNTPLTGPTTFSACFTQDLDQALRLLHTRARTRGGSVVATGFSLGGTVLANWLCEQGADAQALLAGAAVVGADYDLAANNRRLMQPVCGDCCGHGGGS